MKNVRNVIIVFGLALFFAWYAGTWVYSTQYKEPRQKLNAEIAKLSQEITNGKNNSQQMSTFAQQYMPFYYRSLPRQPNEARSLYSFWLLELLQYSNLEDCKVSDLNPARTAFSYSYRFTVQCSGTLTQLTNFLFEFYYAPYLHRITSLSLVPVEKEADKLTLNITIDALALYPRQPNDPYPLVNQLPTGWYIPRLASNDLKTYGIIAQRDFLQTAKGGVDTADYAYLTAINQVGQEKEVWFTLRTDDSVLKVKQGGTVHIGSFNGTLAEILEQDVVLQNADGHWLLSLGDCLNQAFAVP